jgi:hypothetical protein
MILFTAMLVLSLSLLREAGEGRRVCQHARGGGEPHPTGLRPATHPVGGRDR